MKLHYLNKIELHKESSLNFQLFKKVVGSYGILENEIKVVDNIFLLVDKHKKSSMEFVKGDKLIIMGSSIPYYIDVEKVKEYVKTVKLIINKIKNKYKIIGLDH